MINSKKPFPVRHHTHEVITHESTSAPLTAQLDTAPVEEVKLGAATAETLSAAPAASTLSTSEVIKKPASNKAESSATTMKVMDDAVTEVKEQVVDIREKVKNAIETMSSQVAEIRNLSEQANAVETFTTAAEELVPVETVVEEATVPTATAEAAETTVEPAAQEAPAVDAEVAAKTVIEATGTAEAATAEEATEAARSHEKPARTTAAMKSIKAFEGNEDGTPVYHYFYCKRPDGREIVYKRNTASKTYAGEIASLKRSIAMRGITVVKEVIE